MCLYAQIPAEHGIQLEPLQTVDYSVNFYFMWISELFGIEWEGWHCRIIGQPQFFVSAFFLGNHENPVSCTAKHPKKHMMNTCFVFSNQLASVSFCFYRLWFQQLLWLWNDGASNSAECDGNICCMLLICCICFLMMNKHCCLTIVFLLLAVKHKQMKKIMIGYVFQRNWLLKRKLVKPKN